MAQIEATRSVRVKASLDKDLIYDLRGKQLALNGQSMKAVTFTENKTVVMQIYTDDGNGNGWLVAQFVVSP